MKRKNFILTALMVLSAGKIESFFKATDRWQSPPSREEIKRVMEEHDMIIAGPPLKPPQI